VPRADTDRQLDRTPWREEREAFVSGGFGPDESVFDRFGGELDSERFDGPDLGSDSYRVEVDRYWRRTAARRAAAEARRADGLARADRAVQRAREAERAEQAERERRRDRGHTGTSSSADTAAGGSNAEPGDPYRQLLKTWARETAQQPPVETGRRTVTIKGHGAEGVVTRNGTRGSAAERHLQLPRHERQGFQPDRVAMWAVLLGVVMILAAAASAHAAVIAHHVH
jgi:hypothetical protein